MSYLGAEKGIWESSLRHAPISENWVYNFWRGSRGSQYSSFWAWTSYLPTWKQSERAYLEGGSQLFWALFSLVQNGKNPPFLRVHPKTSPNDPKRLVKGFLGDKNDLKGPTLLIPDRTIGQNSPCHGQKWLNMLYCDPKWHNSYFLNLS